MGPRLFLLGAAVSMAGALQVGEELKLRPARQMCDTDT